MSIQFIPTTEASKGNPKIKTVFSDVEDSMLNMTNWSLISLISGLKQTGFGMNTLNSAAHEIRRYKERYFKNNPEYKLLIDSGGYSIIAGDVQPLDISKFIGLYNHYLEYDKDDYDLILSLDVPIMLKYPASNTVQNIHDLNNRSIEQSMEILKNHPDIQSKFMYIWQFKTPKLNAIWEHIYKTHEVHKYVNNYSIGGLVGLHGLTKINFFAATGQLYRTLLAYVDSGRFDNPLNIHLLGVYQPFARVTLTVIEKLFNKYLQDLGINQNVNILFDSFAPAINAVTYARELYIHQYDPRSKKLTFVRDIQYADRSFIAEAYHTDSLINLFDENISRIRSDQMLTSTYYAVPGFINSSIHMDRYFDDWVIDNNIIDLFFTTNNYRTFANKTRPLINKFLKNDLSIHLVKKTVANFKVMYAFHRWWTTSNRKMDTLTPMLESMIAKIGFPSDLR